MWLCNPDDMLDADPFTIPSGWPSQGTMLGGTMRVLSDSTSYPDIKVSLGIQQTVRRRILLVRAGNIVGHE